MAAYECLEANDIKKYAQPGKPKEELVFEVNYYIPDHTVPPKDRAELVAKLIVDLQRSLPMEGMLVPRFPDKVERGYPDKVRVFLLSEEGKYWSRWHTAHVNPKNPAANRVQLRVCFSSPRTAVSVARGELGGRALFSRWLRGAFTPVCIRPRVTTPWR